MTSWKGDDFEDNNAVNETVVEQFSLYFCTHRKRFPEWE